jgi:hypothetical protein
MAWLAACAAAACSSSGGGGGSAADPPATGTDAAAGSCPAASKTTIGDKCAPCLQTYCNDEQSAYAGPNWATASYAMAGGACGDWFACIARCECNAAASCDCKMSSDCQSAAMTVETCTMQNCASACGNSVTTNTGEGICVYGNSAAPCPASGIVGCCKTSAQELCFYGTVTASEGMVICSDMPGGVWSATP